jgi:formylglycine-generating enzyme required for sulfatase activity
MSRPKWLFAFLSILIPWTYLVVMNYGSDVPPGIWYEPVTGIEMVWIPEGCFQMGCGPWSDYCSGDEKPVHEVCLDGFWMGKYLVTQSQWETVMQDNPSKFKKGGQFPVEQVSWERAMQFISKTNKLNNGKYELRLPTEAEWEYAARSGGKPEKYAGGTDPDSVAWYGKNSKGFTHIVGTKEPNGLGLYDMSGNVWEWCNDIYNPKAYSNLPRENPVCTRGGTLRVLRGGSWADEPKFIRCASRHCSVPERGYYAPGFRIVRSR